MKTIRVLLLSLSVVVGSTALLGDDAAKVPKPGEVAVPAGHRMEYPNCDAQQLGSVYERFTGKSVRVSPDLRGTSYSLVVPGPLTNADAARFVENQLLLDGCVIKDDGPGEVTIARGTGPWKMPADGQREPKVRRRAPDPNAITIPAGQVFEYENTDARTSTFLLNMLTGKRYLLAPGVAAVEISMRVDGPLTNAEAVEIVETALLSKGVFLKEFAPGEVVMFPISRSVVEAAAKGTRLPRVMRVPTPRRAAPEKR